MSVVHDCVWRCRIWYWLGFFGLGGKPEVYRVSKHRILHSKILFIERCVVGPGCTLCCCPLRASRHCRGCWGEPDVATSGCRRSLWRHWSGHHWSSPTPCREACYSEMLTEGKKREFSCHGRVNRMDDGGQDVADNKPWRSECKATERKGKQSQKKSIEALLI